MVSPQRRSEIIDALRRGTVPQFGLDALAVGLARFEPALDEELGKVAAGRGTFKAVRGDYGSGKTFFGRWLQERARTRGFASSEVQISETETPLHRMETVYRRVIERLATADAGAGAFRTIIDGWFFALEQDVLADKTVDAGDEGTLLARTEALLEQRLAAVSRVAPPTLRRFARIDVPSRRVRPTSPRACSPGSAGQPNVAAHIRRVAGIKGEIDHFGAANFLAGLLTDPARLRLCGSGPGARRGRDLAARARRFARARAQRVAAVDRRDRRRSIPWLVPGDDRHPGVSSTARKARSGCLRWRSGLHVDFKTEARFDNPRAVQIRLPGFDLDQLASVGCRVRDIYVEAAGARDRIGLHVDDPYVRDLASAVTGQLGGKVGIAPRLFLKKLVADVLDRVDQFSDFDPRRHYALTLSETDLTAVERAARRADSVDDIDL